MKIDDLSMAKVQQEGRRRRDSGLFELLSDTKVAVPPKEVLIPEGPCVGPQCTWRDDSI